MRITITIPDDWTPRQAWAAYETLSFIATAIWEAYEAPLIELCRPDLEPDPRQQEHECTRFADDDVPF